MKILKAGKNEMGDSFLRPRVGGMERQRGRKSRGLEGFPIGRAAERIATRLRGTEGPYARPSTILVSTRFIVQGGIWRPLCPGEKASPLPKPRWSDNENRFRSQSCKRERSASLKFKPRYIFSPEM